MFHVKPGGHAALFLTGCVNTAVSRETKRGAVSACACRRRCMPVVASVKLLRPGVGRGTRSTDIRIAHPDDQRGTSRLSGAGGARCLTSLGAEPNQDPDPGETEGDA